VLDVQAQELQPLGNVTSSKNHGETIRKPRKTWEKHGKTQENRNLIEISPWKKRGSFWEFMWT
jgi:hypothetical protein